MPPVTSHVANFLGTGIDLFPLPMPVGQYASPYAVTLPGFRTQELTLEQPTQSNISPYTQSAEMIQFPGAERWSCTVSLPPLTRYDAAKWTATLQGLRGTMHAFQFGDQLYQGPHNLAALEGAMVVVSTNTTTPNIAGTTTLGTRGWPANTWEVVTFGDYLQVGYRFYRVMGPASSDANGDASIVVGPSLRETPADGTAIDFIAPVGIFRLTQDIKPSVDSDKLTALSFSAVEVR